MSADSERLSPRDALELLHRAAIKSEVSAELADAIGVIADHVLRLEQTLDLIASGVSGALRDKPDNAVLRSEVSGPDAAERWRLAHPDELEKYRGQQIAIHPTRGIVASGSSYGEVKRKVKALGLLGQVTFDGVER